MTYSDHNKTTQYPSAVYLCREKLYMNRQKPPQCEQDWKNLFVHKSIFQGQFEVKQMILLQVFFFSVLRLVTWVIFLDWVDRKLEKIDHLTHWEADAKHLMECCFQANCPSEPKQMGLCERIVWKTVYFAFSFDEEHKKSQPPRQA